MAFLSLTDLRNRVIRRLRQVQGANTQLYSEEVIDDMIVEAYEMCRSARWWDHLMVWESRDLDGTTGKITVPIVGCRERFRDIRMVLFGNNSTPLPIIAQGINPYKLNGSQPRFIEALAVGQDSAGTSLFRVWPLTSVTTDTTPLRIWCRQDPANIFSDPTVIVPFDSICLINRAAALYAADDGANPAQLEMLNSAFSDRFTQLKQQHDTAPIILDPRMDRRFDDNDSNGSDTGFWGTSGGGTWG